MTWLSSYHSLREAGLWDHDWYEFALNNEMTDFKKGSCSEQVIG